MSKVHQLQSLAHLNIAENGSPLIGMPARMDPGQDNQCLSRHYADSLASVGGVPMVLPLLQSPQCLRPLLERLDGILLTGSASDMDPAKYGAAREKDCGPIQPLRDATDFFLLDHAAARKLPVLAICYGMQALNVFMGGSLIQHIPAKIATSIEHNSSGPGEHPSHEVEIKAGSVLEGLAGGCLARVNSTHHQAADKIGAGLEVIARAPDGIVEAVVSTNPGHWVLGVQWHPEKSYALDSLSQRIFQRFLEECRNR